LYYLSRHDFAVDAADVDAGVEAGFVVGVNHVAPKCLIGTGSAVVWSLEKKEKCTQQLRHLQGLPLPSFVLNWSSKAEECLFCILVKFRYVNCFKVFFFV